MWYSHIIIQMYWFKSFNRLLLFPLFFSLRIKTVVSSNTASAIRGKQREGNYVPAFDQENNNDRKLPTIPKNLTCTSSEPGLRTKPPLAARESEECFILSPLPLWGGQKGEEVKNVVSTNNSKNDGKIGRGGKGRHKGIKLTKLYYAHV